MMALGLAIIEYAKNLGLGLSSFVSVGNKADVSGNDLLQFWEDDPQTDVILLYLESFGNPRRFARLARRVGRKKPILAVKSGRTSAGKRAAGSHTAALAASDVGVDALFRQAGVIRADTLEEMFDIASLLVHQPLPKGKRVAILTNGGGPGILCADALEAEGLELPVLAPETQAKLREFLPPAAAVSNPVDMIASASADDYRRALACLLDDPNVDSVVVLFIDTGSADAESVAKAIKQGRKEAQTGREKPLVASFMSEVGVSSLLVDEEEAIPSYRFPESVARALAKAVQYSEWRSQPAGKITVFDDMDLEAAKAVCEEALSRRGDGWLLPDEVDRVLKAAGIPTVPTRLCLTEDEAVKAAEELGYPVVVKLASATLVHKSEWKGVHLNLK
ncbi:MAG: acetate--CoA ligase family protein, partial [Clostridia bacterium]